MKFLLIFASLLFVFGNALATEEEATPKFQQCPTTMMSEKCLDCHGLKKIDGKVEFVLKEINPDFFYTYPNEFTKVREIDGVTYGIYRCLTIDDDDWFDAVDFFRINNIKDILFEIHNPGGSMYDMLRMIGLMRELQSDGVTIHTRAYGEAASAGFMLFISGTTGCRLVHSNALLMMHQLKVVRGGWGGVSISSPAEHLDDSEKLKYMQDTIEGWIIEKSNGKLDIKTLQEKIKYKEWWLRGEDMITYGLADGFVHEIVSKE